jgi:LmbE family N-acetylglucosaminyl deacetylase
VTFVRREVTPPSRFLDSWKAQADGLPHGSPVDAIRAQPGDDVLVLAAHPDDETFGLGASVSSLTSAGVRVHVVALTEGEAALDHLGVSVPGLREQRRAEFGLACNELGATTSHVLDLGDGRLRHRQDELDEVLGQLTDTLRPIHVFAPWWGDPHPDHAAVGEAALRVGYHSACAITGYLIWALQWMSPDDIPAKRNRMTVFANDQRARAARRAAAGCYRSQTEPLHATVEAVLPHAMLDSDLELGVAG